MLPPALTPTSAPHLPQIASAFDVTVEQLLDWNRDIKKASLIYPKQVIKLQEGCESELPQASARAGRARWAAACPRASCWSPTEPGAHNSGLTPPPTPPHPPPSAQLPRRAGRVWWSCCAGAASRGASSKLSMRPASCRC